MTEGRKGTLTTRLPHTFATCSLIEIEGRRGHSWRIQCKAGDSNMEGQIQLLYLTRLEHPEDPDCQLPRHAAVYDYREYNHFFFFALWFFWGQQHPIILGEMDCLWWMHKSIGDPKRSLKDGYHAGPYLYLHVLMARCLLFGPRGPDMTHG